MAALLRLYRRRVPTRQILTLELADAMSAIAHELHRQVSILVNRRGQIVAVSLGDARRLVVPNMETGWREARSRLSGLRCLVVNPSGGGLSLSHLTTLARNRFDLLGSIELEDGKPGAAWLAYLVPEDNRGSISWKTEDPKPLRQIAQDDFQDLIDRLERDLSEANAIAQTDSGRERAILVTLADPDLPRWQVDESLSELTRLAQTAGAEVVSTRVQRRDRPHPVTLLGAGKVEELALLAQQRQATMVIFDAELSASQQRNLSKEIGVKILDRTELILDIFSQRAQSREGKLQVELAQLNYMLPRLGGQGKSMSRLGGGIGTRGPGETKLESDRRSIRRRISHLEREVEQLKQHRRSQRKSRTRRGAIVSTLVGYTNAGKSSLLNALTDAGVLAENKLFATLDPRTRRIFLPGGQTLLMTDTVGFIQKLPTTLIASFRATLEEVTEADILVHVIDASSLGVEEHIAAVEDILFELEAWNKPFVTVFNKADLVTDSGRLRSLMMHLPNPVAVSTVTGEGIPRLKALLDQLMTQTLLERDGDWGGAWQADA